MHATQAGFTAITAVATQFTRLAAEAAGIGVEVEWQQDALGPFLLIRAQAYRTVRLGVEITPGELDDYDTDPGVRRAVDERVHLQVLQAVESSTRP